MTDDREIAAEEASATRASRRRSDWEEQLVCVCFRCRETYNRFYVRCPFCGSSEYLLEPRWMARLM